MNDATAVALDSCTVNLSDQRFSSGQIQCVHEGWVRASRGNLVGDAANYLLNHGRRVRKHPQGILGLVRPQAF